MINLIFVIIFVACNALQAVSFCPNNYYNRFSPKFEFIQRPGRTSSTSHIEVVMSNIGTSVSSSLNDTATSTEKITATITDHKSTLLGQIKNGKVDGDDVELTQPTASGKIKNERIDPDDTDVPQPTANGGYSHTVKSRAKISAANKGKVPWNKGKPRSEEVKARIAAGVRAKNRERLLKKLEDMGMTEEEYEAEKKDQRRKKEADRRARRTAKGGYRPTEATKKKISQILKEKHAKGEVKSRSKVDPSKVRRGFTHVCDFNVI